MLLNRRQAAALALLLAVLVTGCAGLRPSDDALASHIYTRKRLDQLKTSGVEQVAFEEEPAKAASPLTQIPDKLNESFQKATGKDADPEMAKQLYAEGEASFSKASTLQGGARSRQFLAAATSYAAAARKWPDSALEEDALFMIGECKFFADEYPDANEAFEVLLKKYPQTRHLDRTEARRFSMAQFWLQQYEKQNLSFFSLNMTDKTRPLHDNFGHSLRVFNKIRLDDPTGKLADDATLAAGNAHFAAGNFIQADEFFTDLRKAYPTSEHQFAAHLLSVKAKLESYQGPEYSGDALQQAEELIMQIRKQFPQDAEREREFLGRAYAEVRHRKAEREWWMARYFDRRLEYRAARQHYRTIVDDFKETSYVARAQQRLESLGGKPDTPPERLGWLINLFPRNEEVKPLWGTSGSNTVRR